MTRYRLKMQQGWASVLAEYFTEYDGMMVVETKNKNEFCVYPGSEAHVTLIDIPAVLQDILLEPIKDEPMSAEEYVEKTYPVEQYEKKTYWQDEDIRLAYVAGAAENEKKHRPQQSFDEWYSDHPIKKFLSTGGGSFDVEEILESAWEACKAAHNLPEEN